MILSVTFVPAAVACSSAIGSMRRRKTSCWCQAKRFGMVPLPRVDDPPGVVLTAAAVAVILCGLIATRMGSEFVPNLNRRRLRDPGAAHSRAPAFPNQSNAAAN